MFEDIFYRKKWNTDKLARYGFQKGNGWYYDTPVMDHTFRLRVSVSERGAVDTDLVEYETNEPYVLYKTEASGAFVGAVRTEISDVLQKIAEECCDPSLFKSAQTLEIIDYVKNTYGDELEFLWPKFPDNAIWRRKDNQKWYGLILTLAKSKLGLPSDETAEIIDLRLQRERMPETIDRKRYFPGWHMNKNSWYTVILDGSVPTVELCRRVDESYRLAEK